MFSIVQNNVQQMFRWEHCSTNVQIGEANDSPIDFTGVHLGWINDSSTKRFTSMKTDWGYGI